MPLDIERHPDLISYLRRSGRVADGVEVRATTLAGGVSNRTVLVELSDGRRWVVKQALAKLRVAVEWFSDVARIHREALALWYLPEVCPPGTITPLVFEDPAEHLLAMDAVPTPHENWKTLLLAGDVRDEHVRQFARLVARLRRESARRSDLKEVFADRSFFESLRLEPYYQFAATRVPAAGDFLAALVSRTRGMCESLVHGDYSPKNVLVHRDRLVLLDHEVIHFGDPAFDLGFALTHLLSKAHHMFQRREVLARAAKLFFRESGGGDIEERVVGHTLGCLLARVAGRSPLEYLGSDERERQQRAVVGLMHSPPPTIEKLTDDFLSRV